MKKRLQKIAFVATLITSMFLIYSCETEEDCEKNNYGTVEVTNLTGESIYVDVTWGNNDVNDERRLTSGSTTTYNKVPTGVVEIKGSFSGQQGTWDNTLDYVLQCQTLDFNFTAKKSGIQLTKK